MKKLKVLELFGGIGACSKALEKIGIDYEIVDYVEIDKYAVASFNAIHETNFIPQDICQWNKNIEVDLIMHGSPCQDFSLAGKQAGGDKDSGTRSSLMYETIRIVEKLKPKYVIWENVKNLLSKKHIHNYQAYLKTMEMLGYANYSEVLNAKDYGIPQNRERVFTVSIRDDGYFSPNTDDIVDDETTNFEFPPKQELKLKLKDMLEDEVDEKYYLSDKMINSFYQNEQKQQEKGNGFKFGVSDGNVIAKTITTRAGSRMDDNYINKVKRLGGIFDKENQKHQAGSVYDSNGLCPTLDTATGGYRQPCIKIKNATKQGYLEATDGDGIDLAQPNSKTRRGRVQKDTIQTLTTQNNLGVVNDDLRIRKLTPKECWRLMGFDDEDFVKASKVNSNTQLYKQAGNSIVVNVLEAIFKKLFMEDL